MPVEIRQVHPGDEALFERIADDVFDAPVGPGRLSAYLAAPGHIMIHEGARRVWLPNLRSSAPGAGVCL
jgi:hypothetical protein